MDSGLDSGMDQATRHVQPYHGSVEKRKAAVRLSFLAEKKVRSSGELVFTPKRRLLVKLKVARSERRAFRDSSGTLVTPRRETVSHYHGRLECIRAVEPNFVPATLRISTNIYNQLHAIHREYISSVFSIAL